MRLLLNILACLTLVVGLGSTAMAHALERPDVSMSAQAPTAEQVADGHSPGDSDQVPADGDKGYPHHHGGCHGDHIAHPIKLAATTSTASLRAVPMSRVRTMLPRSTADPALRPPQA